MCMLGHVARFRPRFFRPRATGAGIVVDGHDLTLITAGLNAITLITGFVVFAAVRRSLPFDRRLALSRYRHSALIAAKTTAALAVIVCHATPDRGHGVTQGSEISCRLP